jgi:hypothetical protein
MSSSRLTPELIHNDQNGMVFSIANRLGRALWGLLCAGLGITCIIVPVVIGPDNLGTNQPDAMSPWLSQVVAAVLGLVFVAVGWGLACSIEEVRLEFSARTYLSRIGTWPFVRRRAGGFDEFSHISLKPTKTEYHNRDVAVWIAVLEWKESTQQPLTLFEEIDDSVNDGPTAPYRMRTQLQHVASRLALRIEEIEVEPSAGVSESALEVVRGKLYGDAKSRLLDQEKAIAALGIMTLASLLVRAHGEWYIVGIVPVSGYVIWVLVVLYVSAGLLWEILKPSVARVNQSPLRTMLFAGLTAAAAAICLIAPVLRQ